MKNKKAEIRVIAASVKGMYHKTKQQSCQDCFAHACRNGRVVAVVSDGAGSAKYGKIGAKVVCETLCDILPSCTFADIEKHVVKALEVARQKLIYHRFNKTKSERSLVDFSATVVGCVCLGGKGLFFHIGDGAALAFHQDNFEHFTASRPENGHFSCETYFYTMDDWKDSLRFTSFDKAHTLFLMSDGLTNFSFSKDYSHIEKNFIVPIDNFLTNATNKRKAKKALENTLNNAKARKLNSDDKTLLWVKL